MSRDDHMRRYGIRTLLGLGASGLLAAGLAFLSAPAGAQDRLDVGRSVIRSKQGSTAGASSNSAPHAASGKLPAFPDEPGEGEPKPATSPRPQADVAPPELEPPPPRNPRAPATDLPISPGKQKPLQHAPEAQENEISDAPELLEEPWAEPLAPERGWWVGAEYLMWWRSGSALPPLVTTSPSGTSAQDAGVLGSGAAVLYGDQVVGGQARPGGRLNFGWWADTNQTRGWVARAYFVETSVATFDASQAEFPILARPFLDVSGTPDQNALLVAFPTGQGNIQVRSESDVVGGDALWRQMIYISPRSRVDLLLGYQFAHLNESLNIESVSNPGPAQFSVRDSFATTNEFNGGAVGLQFVYDRPGVRLDLLAKVGLGNMHQSVLIDGDTNGAANGLLVQSTNRGLYSRNEFTAIPEFGATVSWCVTDSVEFSLGYSFLFFPNVVQPQHAIDPDLAVNLSVPFVGANRPEFAFQDGNYWVQGLNLGFAWRY